MGEERLNFKGKNRVVNYVKNRKHYHKAKYFGFVVAVLIGVALVVGVLFTFGEQIGDIGNTIVEGITGNSRVESGLESSTPRVLEEGVSLAEFLQGSEFVADMPKKGIIGLNVGKSMLTIKKDLVLEEEAVDADIYIYLEESYLDEMKRRDICEVLSEAFDEGGVYTETSLSKAELSWKYKGMLKYRDCLGL